MTVIEEKLIIGGIDRQEVVNKVNELKALGIEVALIMCRSPGEVWGFHPAKLNATYKKRKTIVEYCIFTRLTTRLSQNDKVAYVKQHNVIEFMDYVKDLFLGSKNENTH